MRRKFVSHPLNEIETKYTVTLESDLCPPFGVDGKKAQFQLLSTLVDSSGVGDCGPLNFQTLNMRHDGEKWIIILEAIG
jgi:hypothetical protein